MGNGGSYTEEEWFALCEKYGHICLWCHRKTKLTVDHIIPISRGGTNDIGNIQPLCLHCNLEKSDKIMDFRKYHDLFIITAEAIETE
jgi:5-methylcytosine-specific restriction protein A